MKKVMFFLILSITYVSAQTNMSFEFDYARFKYDSTQTYLEIYYSIGQGSLTSYSIDDKLLIGTYLDISLRDTLINNVLVNKGRNY